MLPAHVNRCLGAGIPKCRECQRHIALRNAAFPLIEPPKGWDDWALSHLPGCPNYIAPETAKEKRK